MTQVESWWELKNKELYICGTFSKPSANFFLETDDMNMASFSPPGGVLCGRRSSSEMVSPYCSPTELGGFSILSFPSTSRPIGFCSNPPAPAQAPTGWCLRSPPQRVVPGRRHPDGLRGPCCCPAHRGARRSPSISTAPSLSSASQRTLSRLSLSSQQTFPLPAEVTLSPGMPHRFPDYCEVFGARLSKLKESLGALHGVGDSQLECTLLRSCLALPKVSFILRACPPSHIQRTAAEFDRAIRCTLETYRFSPAHQTSPRLLRAWPQKPPAQIGSA